MGAANLKWKKVLWRCLGGIAFGLLFLPVAINRYGFDWRAVAISAGACLAACLVLAGKDLISAVANVTQTRDLSTIAALCAEAHPGILADQTEEFREKIADELMLEEVLEENTVWHRDIILFLSRMPSEDSEASLFVKRAHTVFRLEDIEESSLDVEIGLIVRDRGISARRSDVEAQIMEGLGVENKSIRWAVQLNEEKKEVTCIHASDEGRSTPCFAAIVGDLLEKGYQAEFAVREAPGLYRRAAKAAEAFPWWKGPA